MGGAEGGRYDELERNYVSAAEKEDPFVPWIIDRLGVPRCRDLNLEEELPFRIPSLIILESARFLGR